MNVELVQVAAADGVRLDGALQRPPEGNAGAAGIDAWLLLHGTGSNFYSGSTLSGVAPKLLELGAAVLRVNTRGHDLVCTAAGAAGGGFLGAAFERVDQSPLDIAAWLDWLRASGYRRLGLLGHSLGAVKAVYAMALDESAQVERLVAVSPPRLSYRRFRAGPKGEEFLAAYRAAEKLVAEGRPDTLMEVRFPLTYLVSAAAYLDRYGPAEKYDVVPLAARLPCPALFTYGSIELTGNVAFAGSPEALAELALSAARLQVAVIAGADHVYTACTDALAARIAAWLRKTAS